MSDWLVVLVPAVVGLIGGTLGLVGGMFVRLRESDARRWQADRRVVYASYLGVVQSMSREINDIGHNLRQSPTNRNDSVDAKTWSQMNVDAITYCDRWDTELQASLMELQLLSSPPVAVDAQRVSGALLSLVHYIDDHI